MAERQLLRGKVCVDARWCSITHVGPVSEVLHCQHVSFFAEGHVALLLAGSEPVGLCRVGRIGEEDHMTLHPNLDTLKATIRTEWDSNVEEFLINSCKTFNVVWKVSLKL
ncbi:Uncharacterized protein FKW44_003037 [Caligus rogercresseyi]|uniref:Uncharacterized protein n=1 Tax=Caligus rogercresseyi TaxID=217165 RepID=A0A7T8QWN3_CALRO|nr:Uncharacterized protein FKW44_003037 [Caligus rogercresseyi]